MRRRRGRARLRKTDLVRIRDKAQDEQEAPVNLMPLIDMVFLLLIFFLVATQFAQEERDLSVQLPGTAKAEPLSAPPRQLIINIQADGTAVVATERYDMKGLADLLVRAARQHPDQQILIRADQRSLHLYFARVASLCREVGIHEVNVGYIIEQPKAQHVD